MTANNGTHNTCTYYIDFDYIVVLEGSKVVLISIITSP